MSERLIDDDGRCRLCRKDMSKAVELLTYSDVYAVHHHAHEAEAVGKVLMQARRVLHSSPDKLLDAIGAMRKAFEELEQLWCYEAVEGKNP